MKPKFALFLLSFALLPPPAEAQNVLVPNANVTSTKAVSTPAPTSTKAATIQSTTTAAPPSYSLDQALAASPTVSQAAQQDAVASTTQNVMATTYVSPTQINSMVQMEQNNVSMMQSAVNSMQATNSMLSATAASRSQMQLPPGTTPAGIAAAGNVQQTLAANTIQMASSQTSMQAQLARAQYRLKVLQSGPLTIAQLSALYQGGI